MQQTVADAAFHRFDVATDFCRAVNHAEYAFLAVTEVEMNVGMFAQNGLFVCDVVKFYLFVNAEIVFRRFSAK